MRGGETITYIFIDKYLGGGRSAVSLILIIGLEVWRGVLFAGLFVWAVEAGLGPFSQNVSSVNLGVWGGRKVADVFGTVLRCQKGQGQTTRTEILCFLFGSDMVACSWLGGCLLWGNRLKSGVDVGGGYRIEIFFL